MALSREAASLLFDISNWVLLVGLILGVISTFSIIWMGNIKEEYLRSELGEANAASEMARATAARANERAAALENDAAQARARAAELENEIAQRRLEYEQLRNKMAWRRLTEEQHRILVDRLTGHQMEIWLAFVGDDLEAELFRGDIYRSLTDAGIRTKYFSGLKRAIGLRITDVPGPEYDALVAAFVAAGLTLVPAPPARAGLLSKLTIIVGSKPPPF